MIYKFLMFLAGLMNKLSHTKLEKLAASMAFLVWYTMPRRRRVAIEALKKHLHLSDDEAKVLARKSFTENFISFLEIFHVNHFFTDKNVNVVITEENKAKLVAETAPIIVATAHLGSWELMPGLANDLLPTRERMVIVRKHGNEMINRVMADLRGARGMNAIDHRQAIQVVLPALKKGGVAAFLVDHNSNRQESVFLPFLEDTAAVNMGPALLAMRSKAAVYPIFLIRDGNGKHLLYILSPLHTANLDGTISERVEKIAKFYTDAVAEVLKKHPEQWFWMHKRWKTRPKIKKHKERIDNLKQY